MLCAGCHRPSALPEARCARTRLDVTAEDVEFVTVGLTWLRGRADLEIYHARGLKGRFREIVHTVLETDVDFIQPEVAVVRHSRAVKGDKNPDGPARAPRFGLMTMLPENETERGSSLQCKM